MKHGEMFVFERIIILSIKRFTVINIFQSKFRPVEYNYVNFVCWWYIFIVSTLLEFDIVRLVSVLHAIFSLHFISNVRAFNTQLCYLCVCIKLSTYQCFIYFILVRILALTVNSKNFLIANKFDIAL